MEVPGELRRHLGSSFLLRIWDSETQGMKNEVVHLDWVFIVSLLLLQCWEWNPGLRTQSKCPTTGPHPQPWDEAFTRTSTSHITQVQWVVKNSDSAKLHSMKA